MRVEKLFQKLLGDSSFSGSLSHMESSTKTTSYLDKDTRAAEIREDLAGALRRLAGLSEAARQDEHFSAWLRSQAAFHHYSWRNAWLIGMQCPGASRVAGFRQWEKLGRAVRRGQKALWILAPSKWKKEVETAAGKEEREGLYFRQVPVFDISQTEVIEGQVDGVASLAYRGMGEDAGLCAALEAVYTARGIQLSYPADLPGTVKGRSWGGRVEVLATLTGAARAATLAHELAHEILHHGEVGQTHSRSTMEIEAEATSWAVLQHFGVEQHSEYYLAAWGGDLKAVEGSLKAIQTAVRAIVEAIEGATTLEDAS